MNTRKKSAALCALCAPSRGDGECGGAVISRDLRTRLMQSNKLADQAVTEKIDVFFPHQSRWAAHIDIAGDAVAKSVDNAVECLECVARPPAQKRVANGNAERPAAKGISTDKPARKPMPGGSFQRAVVPIRANGMNQERVQLLLDRGGYQGNSVTSLARMKSHC